MAVLSVASAGSGFFLLGTGSWQIVLSGVIACLVGLIIACLIELVVAVLDAIALATLSRAGRPAGRAVGVISGLVPMLVILAWGYATLLRGMHDPAQPLALWLWSYGVALGPWTIFALSVGGERRSLCGIRAYAAHLAYWLLSALVLIVHAPLVVIIPIMFLPAILPVTVGALLAAADREALRNVRI